VKNTNQLERYTPVWIPAQVWGVDENGLVTVILSNFVSFTFNEGSTPMAEIQRKHLGVSKEDEWHLGVSKEDE